MGALNWQSPVQQGATWKRWCDRYLHLRCSNELSLKWVSDPRFHHWEKGQSEKQTVLPSFSTDWDATHSSKAKCHLFQEGSLCVPIWNWCCSSKAVTYGAECHGLHLPLCSQDAQSCSHPEVHLFLQIPRKHPMGERQPCMLLCPLESFLHSAVLDSRVLYMLVFMSR